MHPVAYLAVRVLINLLQLLEGSDRAFAHTAPLVLAAGAAHCWAVAYAILVAIVAQATRLADATPGSGNFVDQLPSFVLKAEVFASLSMLVWCLSGLMTFFLRAVKLDEDAQGLPVDIRDAAPIWFMDVLRMPVLKRILSVLNLLSCGGVFVSVLLFFVAMAKMASAFTFCQFLLTVAAFGFAAPHALLALRRGCSSAAAGLDAGPLGAAAESATIGPQLCVILSLADISGHASLLHRIVHVSSVTAFAASVIACGRSPPRRVGSSGPAPLVADLVAVLMLNTLTIILLVASFPELRRDKAGLLIVLLVSACAIALFFRDVREAVTEFAEPVMPTRSSVPEKRPPSPARDGLRAFSRVTALVCVASALWEVISRRAEVRRFDHYYDDFGNSWEDRNGASPYSDETPYSDDTWHDTDFGDHDYDDHHHGLPAEDFLLLRWRQELDMPGVETLLQEAVKTLGLHGTEEITHEGFVEGVLVFRLNGILDEAEDYLPDHVRWQTALGAREDNLEDIADLTFPAYLDGWQCQLLFDAEEADSSRNESESARGAFIDSATESEQDRTTATPVPSAEDTWPIELREMEAGTRSALAEACKVWRDHGRPDEGEREDSSPPEDEDYVDAIPAAAVGHVVQEPAR